MAEGDEEIVDVEDITSPEESPSDDPDENTLEDKQVRELLRDGYQIASYKARLKSFVQDVGERKRYASKIFWLVCGWLFVLVVLLAAAGTQQFPFVYFWGVQLVHFELSDKVLIALIGGTTLDLIGLFLIVANYLFHRNAKIEAKATRVTAKPKRRTKARG